MFKTLFATIVLVIAADALPARGAAKDDVQSAIGKLSEASSFAWSSRMQSKTSSETEEGAAEKGGYTVLSKTFKNAAQDTHIEVVRKGSAGVLKWDAGWQTFEEATKAAGANPAGRARATVIELLRSDKSVAAAAQDMLTHTPDLKKDGDAYEGELTEAGVKALLEAASSQVQVKGAKGQARFWVKDGVLSKVGYHLQASLTMNGRARAIEGAGVAEVKDVGTAKARVPEEAKKKLEGQPEVPF